MEKNMEKVIKFGQARIRTLKNFIVEIFSKEK